ncbi:MAG: pepT [Clostridia bacterium]|jgi:tripeptide aminopeptidase|nr:pepT [Clostridia bacterium]
MKAYERLLKYVAIHTTSDEKSETHPTTERQFDLANILAEEMREIGIEEVRVTKECYVYGMIPATRGYEDKKSIGFVAHMDTSPTADGNNVKPQVITNYNGGDVLLKGSNLVLSPERFPHLTGLKGRTLITTDGTTLLGADDKAGIAEILTACEIILTTDIPHGKIGIAFTPDEEVGKGAELFDVKGFGVEFAYTVDGGEEGEITYENFNAAEVSVEIQGVSVHPGSAKNKMINALNVAFEFNDMLPKGERPEHTEDYEGFYFLRNINGDSEKAVMAYSLRDHNRELFEGKKAAIKLIEKLLNEKYGKGTVEVTLTDRYKNMLDAIKPHFHLVENAIAATKNLEVTPLIIPMRGGTDGATLSYMGLPCPNIGTGGYAYHGAFEHITTEGMDRCTGIIIEIIKAYALNRH